jgi:hypothetical protein
MKWNFYFVSVFNFLIIFLMRIIAKVIFTHGNICININRWRSWIAVVSRSIVKYYLTLSTELLCTGFLSLDDRFWDIFIGCKMVFSSFRSLLVRCSDSRLRLSFGDLAQSKIYNYKLSSTFVTVTVRVPEYLSLDIL